MDSEGLKKELGGALFPHFFSPPPPPNNEGLLSLSLSLSHSPYPLPFFFCPQHKNWLLHI